MADRTLTFPADVIRSNSTVPIILGVYYWTDSTLGVC